MLAVQIVFKKKCQRCGRLIWKCKSSQHKLFIRENPCASVAKKKSLPPRSINQTRSYKVLATDQHGFSRMKKYLPACGCPLQNVGKQDAYATSLRDVKLERYCRVFGKRLSLGPLSQWAFNFAATLARRMPKHSVFP
jgi:hypothetical protein